MRAHIPSYLQLIFGEKYVRENSMYCMNIHTHIYTNVSWGY